MNYGQLCSASSRPDTRLGSLRSLPGGALVRETVEDMGRSLRRSSLHSYRIRNIDGLPDTCIIRP